MIEISFCWSHENMMSPEWDYFLVYKNYAITDYDDISFSYREMLFEIFGKENIIKKLKNRIDLEIKKYKKLNGIYVINIKFHNFYISEEELFYYVLKYGKEPLLYYRILND